MCVDVLLYKLLCVIMIDGRDCVVLSVFVSVELFCY